MIDAHPNVEVRLFNPWRQYSSRRSVKAAQTVERFNFRMHNKQIVADNRIVILGGRNLGNEYFGLNSTFNFLDMDVLGVGPIARESSELFDHFWNSPPMVSGFIGLHMKASVVDRSRVYIGSFNLDPRARDFSTEMGVLVDSPELAEELARLAEELMQPENSWQVKLNGEGKLIWQSGDDIRTRQPAQSSWQRVMDWFFKLFPSKYF